MNAADLLWSLINAFESDQLLPWALLHAPNGDELQQAWDACEDRVPMILLLSRSSVRVTPWLSSECIHRERLQSDDWRRLCPVCCGEIRALHPTLSMDEIVREARLRSGMP